MFWTLTPLRMSMYHTEVIYLLVNLAVSSIERKYGKKKHCSIANLEWKMRRRHLSLSLWVYFSPSLCIFKNWKVFQLEKCHLRVPPPVKLLSLYPKDGRIKVSR